MIPTVAVPALSSYHRLGIPIAVAGAVLLALGIQPHHSLPVLDARRTT